MPARAPNCLMEQLRQSFTGGWHSSRTAEEAFWRAMSGAMPLTAGRGTGSISGATRHCQLTAGG